ncbi:MAG: hypothetical protein IPK50_09735 [Fibrobacterota bacterium]|nr:hypothetical protein [Fibrobacterota bacterium]QQS07159.1 MAG: hypothetical protein IPK50_09735 [Fibrobacterota bacterium]
MGSSGIHAQDFWWSQDERSLLEAPLDEEDTLKESRGGFHLAGSSSPTSSSARTSARWDDRRGIGMQWARSQPGGLRRRRIDVVTENVSVGAGDLDPWSDNPLLEGASRQWGPATSDEAEAWMRGSGKLPNGVESAGSRGPLQLRSRWREDRRKSEDNRSGAVEIGWNQLHAGLRTEQPTGGKFATLSWRDSTWSLSGLATQERLGGLRIRKEPGESGLSGEARWVSGAMHHNGLPSGWSGTTAAQVIWKNPSTKPLLDGFRLEWTRREEMDRALAQSRWRKETGWVEGSLRPSLAWSSPGALHGGVQGRLQRSDRGGWQPSLDASWSDTAVGTGLSLAGTLAWSGVGRRTSAGVFWREEEVTQVSVQQTGSVRAGKHSVELSIRMRSEATKEPQVWAEGGISCAW